MGYWNKKRWVGFLALFVVFSLVSGCTRASVTPQATTGAIALFLTSTELAKQTTPVPPTAFSTPRSTNEAFLFPVIQTATAQAERMNATLQPLMLTVAAENSRLDSSGGTSPQEPTTGINGGEQKSASPISWDIYFVAIFVCFYFFMFSASIPTQRIEKMGIHWQTIFFFPFFPRLSRAFHAGLSKETISAQTDNFLIRNILHKSIFSKEIARSSFSIQMIGIFGYGLIFTIQFFLIEYFFLHNKLVSLLPIIFDYARLGIVDVLFHAVLVILVLSLYALFNQFYLKGMIGISNHLGYLWSNAIAKDGDKLINFPDNKEELETFWRDYWQAILITWGMFGIFPILGIFLQFSWVSTLTATCIFLLGSAWIWKQMSVAAELQPLQLLKEAISLWADKTSRTLREFVFGNWSVEPTFQTKSVNILRVRAFLFFFLILILALEDLLKLPFLSVSPNNVLLPFVDKSIFLAIVHRLPDYIPAITGFGRISLPETIRLGTILGNSEVSLPIPSMLRNAQVLDYLSLVIVIFIINWFAKSVIRANWLAGLWVAKDEIPYDRINLINYISIQLAFLLYWRAIGASSLATLSLAGLIPVLDICFLIGGMVYLGRYMIHALKSALDYQRGLSVIRKLVFALLKPAALVITLVFEPLAYSVLLVVSLAAYLISFAILMVAIAVPSLPFLVQNIQAFGENYPLLKPILALIVQTVTLPQQNNILLTFWKSVPWDGNHVVAGPVLVITVIFIWVTRFLVRTNWDNNESFESTERSDIWNRLYVSFFIAGLLIVFFYLNWFLFGAYVLMAAGFAQIFNLSYPAILAVFLAIVLTLFNWISWFSVANFVTNFFAPMWRKSALLFFDIFKIYPWILYDSLKEIVRGVESMLSLQKHRASDARPDMQDWVRFRAWLNLTASIALEIFAFLFLPKHPKLELSITLPQENASVESKPLKRTFQSGKEILWGFSEFQIFVYGLTALLGYFVFYPAIPLLWIRFTDSSLPTSLILAADKTPLVAGQATLEQFFLFTLLVLQIVLFSTLWYCLRLVYFPLKASFAANVTHRFLAFLERSLLLIFAAQTIYGIQTIFIYLGLNAILGLKLVVPEAAANFLLWIYRANSVILLLLVLLAGRPISIYSATITKIVLLKDSLISHLRDLFLLRKKMDHLNLANFASDFYFWVTWLVSLHVSSILVGVVLCFAFGLTGAVNLQVLLFDWIKRLFLIFYLGWAVALLFTPLFYGFIFSLTDRVQVLFGILALSSNNRSIWKILWTSLRNLFQPRYVLYPGFRTTVQAYWVLLLFTFGLTGLFFRPLEVIFLRLNISTSIIVFCEIAIVFLLGSILVGRVARIIPFFSFLVGLAVFYVIRNIDVIWLLIIPPVLILLRGIRIFANEELPTILNNLLSYIDTLNFIDQKWSFEEKTARLLNGQPFQNFGSAGANQYRKDFAELLADAQNAGYLGKYLFKSKREDPFYQAHILYKSIDSSRQGPFFDLVFLPQYNGLLYVDELRRSVIFRELVHEPQSFSEENAFHSFAENTFLLALYLRQIEMLDRIPFNGEYELVEQTLPVPVSVSSQLNINKEKSFAYPLIASIPDKVFDETRDDERLTFMVQSSLDESLGVFLDRYLNTFFNVIDVQESVSEVLLMAYEEGVYQEETMEALEELQVIYQYLAKAEQATSILDIVEMANLEVTQEQFRYMIDMQPILGEFVSVAEFVAEIEEFLRENRLRPTFEAIEQLRRMDDLMVQVYQPEHEIVNQIIRSWIAILSDVVTDLTKETFVGETRLEVMLGSDSVYWENEESISVNIVNVSQSGAFYIDVKLVPVKNCRLKGTDDHLHISYLPGNKQREVIEFNLEFLKQEEAVVNIVVSYLDGLQKKHTFSQEFHIFYANQAENFSRLKDFSKHTNPYRAGIGMPVRNVREFFGRTEILSDIQKVLADVDHPHAIMLYGQRRMGKTSIIKQIEQNVRRDGIFNPVDASLEKFHFDRLREDGTAGLVHDLASLIWLSLPNHEDFPRPSLDDFKENPAIKFNGEYIPQVREFLAKGNYPTHLLLLMDEFDRLQQLSTINDAVPDKIQQEQMEAFLHILRDYAMNMQGGGLIVVGTHRLLEMAYSYKAAMFNVFTNINVSYFQSDATRQLVNEMAKDILIFDPAVVDKILRLSGGHPYYLRLLCAEIYERCSNLKRHYVGLSVFDDVLMERFQEHIFSVANDLWIGLTDVQKYVISMFARISTQENKFVSTSDIRKELRGARLEISPEQIEQSLDALHQTEILERVSDQYRFFIDLYRIWLRENKTLSAVRVEVGAIPTKSFKSGGKHES